MKLKWKNVAVVVGALSLVLGSWHYASAKKTKAVSKVYKKTFKAKFKNKKNPISAVKKVKYVFNNTEAAKKPTKEKLFKSSKKWEVTETYADGSTSKVDCRVIAKRMVNYLFEYDVLAETWGSREVRGLQARSSLSKVQIAPLLQRVSFSYGKPSVTPKASAKDLYRYKRYVALRKEYGDEDTEILSRREWMGLHQKDIDASVLYVKFKPKKKKYSLSQKFCSNVPQGSILLDDKMGVKVCRLMQRVNACGLNPIMKAELSKKKDRKNWGIADWFTYSKTKSTTRFNAQLRRLPEVGIPVKDDGVTLYEESEFESDDNNVVK